MRMSVSLQEGRGVAASAMPIRQAAGECLTPEKVCDLDGLFPSNRGTGLTSHTYDPGFFQPLDLEHAKSIVLSASDSEAREKRWQEETAFLCEAIQRAL